VKAQPGGRQSLFPSGSLYGRAAVDLTLLLPPLGHVHEQTRQSPKQLHVAGELTVPADDEEAEALALQWLRELERSVGILRFEGEPPG